MLLRLGSLIGQLNRSQLGKFVQVLSIGGDFGVGMAMMAHRMRQVFLLRRAFIGMTRCR